MRYRNVKTGAVIETSSEVHGGDWVAVAAEPEPPVRKPRKKQVKKRE